MNRRTILLISCAVAFAIQFAFVTTYYLITDGCFCAVLSSNEGADPSPGALRFLNAVDLVHRLGVAGQIGDLPSTLISAALNFVIWAALLFAALTATSLLLGRRHHVKTT